MKEAFSVGCSSFRSADGASGVDSQPGEHIVAGAELDVMQSAIAGNAMSSNARLASSGFLP